MGMLSQELRPSFYGAHSQNPHSKPIIPASPRWNYVGHCKTIYFSTKPWICYILYIYYMYVPYMFQMFIGSIRSLHPTYLHRSTSPATTPPTWLLGRHQPLRCGDLAQEQLLSRYSNAYIVVCNIYYTIRCIYTYIGDYIYIMVYIYIYMYNGVYIYIYIYIYIHMIDAYISITPMYRYILYILS